VTPRPQASHSFQVRFSSWHQASAQLCRRTPIYSCSHAKQIDPTFIIVKNKFLPRMRNVQPHNLGLINISWRIASQHPLINRRAWVTSSYLLYLRVAIGFAFMFMYVAPNSHIYTKPVHQIEATPRQPSRMGYFMLVPLAYC
jgi:hypothetical protein